MEASVCVCVCECACVLPHEKRGLLICFPGSSLKREQDTLEAPSDLLPHPSLTFSLSLLNLSFPHFHHLSLVPSAFSPRFLGPPSLCSLICRVGPLWSLYGDSPHLQILPKSSDST